MPNISLALAQINVTVGDIAGNVQKISDAYDNAVTQGAELVVFPELCVIGYPPEDLVLMPAFRAAAMEAVHELAASTKGKAAMIVGSVWEEGDNIYNAALLLDDGKMAHMQPKKHLPNYGVFDEKRLFDSGELSVVEWRDYKLGLLICEDTWRETPAATLKEQGAEILISINDSPFEIGKADKRHQVARNIVKNTGLLLVYVNLVGAQDDIVFDGGSFVMSAQGNIVSQLSEFAENISIYNGAENAQATDADEDWRVWEAMKLGLSDYVHKNGFTDIVLGLSGGIDSAITAVIAADVLGKEHVHGVLLPSPYTSKDSNEDALVLVENLGISTQTVPITPGMQTMEEVLSPVFHDASWMENVAVGGNLQARLRGLTLMALSNQFGWLLLSTGNKSEIAVGYSTLYGDACGGYNVIKDLYKTQVYALAKWRNAQGVVIPERIITKAPSAELKPDQTDQDQLPPYDVLDAILALHIEGRLGAAEIIAKGYDEQVVQKIVKLVRINEFKRRQMSPGVKLTKMQFGKDRRYPLTNKF
ncbi:MAG: NAD+ synthase [Rickettsiales bacterium]